MTKTLNTDVLLNELKGGSAFFPATQPPTQPDDQVHDQPVSQTQSGQESQSVSQSTRQSTNRQLTPPRDGTTIVDRPKAFYITHQLDRRLDEAVRYLQEEHGIKKVDRSVVINAILDTDERWTRDALDHLVETVISQLTSRLTGR